MLVAESTVFEKYHSLESIDGLLFNLTIRSLFPQWSSLIEKGHKHRSNRFREARCRDQSNTQDLPWAEGFIGEQGSRNSSHADFCLEKNSRGGWVEFWGSPRRCK